MPIKQKNLNIISLLLLENFEGEICSLIGLSFCDVNYNDPFCILQHQKGLLRICGLCVVKANGTKQAQLTIRRNGKGCPKESVIRTCAG